MYNKCIDEMDEQLDVALIMKKLIFFERAIAAILTPGQLEALHIQTKDTLDEAEEKRKMYALGQRVKEK